MKKCHICKEIKPLTEFNKKHNRKDGLQTHCRDCNKKLSKDYYSKNKEKHLRAILLRHQRNRELLQKYIIDYLKQHSCIDCQQDNIVVLEFDHVRGIKKMNISKMLHHNVSLQTLKLEINKCDVRCRNCHMIRTANVQNHFKVWMNKNHD